MHELLRDTADTPAFRRYFVGQRRRLLQVREQDLALFLDKVLFSDQPFWVRALGFKVLYSQPWDTGQRRKAWTTLGNISNLHVIWISRNSVRSVISFAVARKTGQWISKRTKKAVELDPDYVLRRLAYEQEEQEEAYGRIRDKPLLKVSFENLVADPVPILKEVQEFLHLPVCSLHTALRRQNPKPLGQLIANYDEVKSALKPTKWYSELCKAEDEQERTEV
jgi:hypothetical protein